ncbi:hypothetical protein PHET_10931 [Paragonimus heterotremus]|uniref:Adenylate kinase n=1 Tax=Paragonimus heterotremus TaxID=100268 RepID=A0A8J4WSG9_9TREM|nr:hypothetical protein PHET_10931 [Paragonimus heterotremus]
MCDAKCCTKTTKNIDEAESFINILNHDKNLTGQMRSNEPTNDKLDRSIVACPSNYGTSISQQHISGIPSATSETYKQFTNDSHDSNREALVRNRPHKPPVEENLLSGNPSVPRFVIIGKPSTGKSQLAQRLSEVWGCVYVNASELILQHIAGRTSTGHVLLNVMLDGRDIDDATVLGIVTQKLESSECYNRGYIIDDLPNNSEKQLSIALQLETLSTINPKPNCFIHVLVPDEEHRAWWLMKRIDPLTGQMYTLTDTVGYVPTLAPVAFSNLYLRGIPMLDRSITKRWVTRHEDLPESLDKHIKFYNSVMKPALCRFLDDNKSIPVLHVSGSATHTDLFENTIQELYNNSDHPELSRLDLFGELAYINTTSKECEQQSSPNVRKSRWQQLRDAFLCNS